MAASFPYISISTLLADSVPDYDVPLSKTARCAPGAPPSQPSTTSSRPTSRDSSSAATSLFSAGNIDDAQLPERKRVKLAMKGLFYKIPMWWVVELCACFGGARDVTVYNAGEATVLLGSEGAAEAFKNFFEMQPETPGGVFDGLRVRLCRG